MNKSMTAWLILITVIVVAFLAALWATSGAMFSRFPFERRAPPPRINPGDIEFYYTAQTVVSSINVTLAIFLLAIYADIYRKTRSEFTIGLIIFSAVFLLNALVSNPLVIFVFGFQSFGLGPFALLPALFTLGALITLLYFSLK